MKKIISIILIASLGVLIFFVLGITFGKKDITRGIELQQQKLPVIKANYSQIVPNNGPDFRTAAEMTVNAVVHIKTKFIRKSSVYDDFFGSLRQLFEWGQQQKTYHPFTAFGSGVIISDDGYIVTNNHVVEGADEIEVTLNDKRVFNAEIIGNDPSADLALIKIHTNDLPYIIYGNSDNVKIGEWVLAVGNPFNLTSTVTAGIVSAKARDINILGTHSSIKSFIQTDAVVNRGNSGGALVNIKGELIGINAAIASSTGFYEGYSFAIPVNIVKKVVNDLLQYGEIQRAYIGVIIQELDAKFAKENGIDEIKGVYVRSLTENGGAEEAGIKKGDIITNVDNYEVNSLSQLIEIVSQHKPGDEVKIDIVRNGKEMVFSVVLKNENGTINIVKKEKSFYNSQLGASFEKVTIVEKQYLGINNGLKIIKLEDGLLKSGGVQKGFIITKINNIPVNLKANLEYALNNLSLGMLNIEGVYPNGMKVIYGFEM